MYFLDGSHPDRDAHMEFQRRPAVGRGFPVRRSQRGVADITEIPPFPGPNNLNLTNRSTTPGSTRLSLNAERSAERRTYRTTGKNPYSSHPRGD